MTHTNLGIDETTPTDARQGRLMAASTQSLPQIWVQVPYSATACGEGIDGTWFHVPCGRYFTSAMTHDCQKTENNQCPTT